MCDCSKLSLSSNYHEPNQCPVSAYLSCSICQMKGHSTMKCPERVHWHYRKPEFVEHFIPIHILSHYNITSLTSLVNKVSTHPPYIHGDPVIEIPFDHDGKNVRATLATYNLPSSSVKENKRVMEEFGELIGKKVVMLDVKEQIKKAKARKLK